MSKVEKESQSSLTSNSSSRSSAPHSPPPLRVDAHASLVKDVVENKTELKDRGDALAYLLRYETMVRQQEAESMAVLAHLRPCVCRLLELVGKENNNEEANPQQLDDLHFLAEEISFADLKKACLILEEHIDNNSSVKEFMTTDRQFMMVLRSLTRKVDTDAAAAATITWAEIVQCYKVCIAGMMTLQHLPQESSIRTRARDRSLAMLSLFESPSTMLFLQDDTTRMDTSPLYTTRRGVAALPNGSPLRNNNRRSRPLLKRKTKRFLKMVLTLAIVIGIASRILDFSFFINEFKPAPKMSYRKRMATKLLTEPVVQSSPPVVATTPELGRATTPEPSPVVEISESTGLLPVPIIAPIVNKPIPSFSPKSIEVAEKVITKPSMDALSVYTDHYDLVTERVSAPITGVLVLVYITAGGPITIASVVAVAGATALKSFMSNKKQI